jgi:16S rRNA (guanine527-N7)-methyltransferase
MQQPLTELPVTELGEEPFGPEDFARMAHVSRETLSRLKHYASLLEDWNARQNLVSEASLRTMWLRHFWDSAQLVGFVPAQARTLIDLGSGAGFPGLVLAELMRESRIRVVLTESTTKKRDFLRAVAERLSLAVEIRSERIEAANPEIFDVITARALAPLPKLLDYAQRFWGKETVGLFLKGQNLAAELTSAYNYWTMHVQNHPSRSSASGTVLEIRGLKRVAPDRTGSR